MRERSARAAGAALALLLGLAGPGTVTAQKTAAAMAAECAGVEAVLLHAFCTDGALALAAARAGVGLALTQGSPVPGSASTLGRRMASSPRLAFSLRGGLARAPFADPNQGPRARRLWPASIEGQITVGLLEGWSLLPTVGGFLSLDLIGLLGLARLSGNGFAGSAEEVGYGARVGIFRESFTLPGVSASIARRHAAEVVWGAPTEHGASFSFRPTVTSVRATAAKDLLAIGVLGGWGWDRYGGPSELVANRFDLAINRTGQASSDDFHTDRQLVFLGLSYTLLVFQLSAEGGWAKGWSGPAGTRGWDPGSGSFFGSAAARLTY
jgi:hypothetical protein